MPRLDLFSSSLRRLLAGVGAGLLAVVVGGLVGCSHHPRATDHLFPEVTAMGHRGAAGLAPENTLAAFKVAQGLGIPFELDTFFAGSGELVVFHDDDLLRVTGAPGTIHGLALPYLQTLDAGSHFDPAFAGQRIPTLDQVFAAIAGEVVINVEVKSKKGSDNRALAAAVAATIEAHDLIDRVIVTSFSPFFLGELRARQPAIVRGQLVATFKDSDLRGYERVLLRNLAFNRRARPDLLSVEHVMITPRYLRKMHRRGYKVFAWTVNEEEEMRRLVDLGIDGIITDYPDRLLEVLGERRSRGR